MAGISTLCIIQTFKVHFSWNISISIVFILSFRREYPERFLDLSDPMLGEHHIGRLTEDPDHLGEVLKVYGGHPLMLCNHEVAQKLAFQTVPFFDQDLTGPARLIAIDLQNSVIRQNIFPHGPKII